MQGQGRRLKGLGLVLLMCSFSLAGCTELLDTTADPRATMEAYPLLIQEGEMVTLMPVNRMRLKASLPNIAGILAMAKNEKQ